MSKKPGKSSTGKISGTGEKTDLQVSIAKIGAIATVSVAIIGLIGTIAKLSFDYLQWSSSRPTPIPPTTSIPALVSNGTPTFDTNAPTPSKTDSPENPFPTSTSTKALPPTLMAISTDTSIPTATIVVAAIGMDVQLIVDQTSGRSPLKVNFDARGSFLRDAEGKIFNCSGGLCDYTWSVYQGSKLLNKPESSHNGTFSYRFGSAGDYRVVVKVCRGQEESDCAYDAEDISVR